MRERRCEGEERVRDEGEVKMKGKRRKKKSDSDSVSVTLWQTVPLRAGRHTLVSSDSDRVSLRAVHPP